MQYWFWFIMEFFHIKNPNFDLKKKVAVKKGKNRSGCSNFAFYCVYIYIYTYWEFDASNKNKLGKEQQDRAS